MASSLVETLTAVVTLNNKTVFFMLAFIRALADIIEDKILTSPVKSLGFFSLLTRGFYFILK